MSDPLQLLPVDQWHKLKDVLRRDWPRSICGITLLETMEGIIHRGCDYGFKVYCPYGDIENGMVGVNIKKEYTEYVIQNPKDDHTRMEEALRTTQILNHPKLVLSFTPRHLKHMLQNIAKEWNMTQEYCATTETFLLNRNTPYEVELPSGFTFEPMSLEYIELVDSVWPHKYPSSDWYYQMLTKAKLGYGLFHKKELLSWVYVKEMGALGHWHTLEKHRRKGYGEIVLKLISNILIEQGKPVFAFCVIGNTRARNVYIKVGFDRTQDVDWISLIKQRFTD